MRCVLGKRLDIDASEINALLAGTDDLAGARRFGRATASGSTSGSTESGGADLDAGGNRAHRHGEAERETEHCRGNGNWPKPRTCRIQFIPHSNPPGSMLAAHAIARGSTPGVIGSTEGSPTPTTGTWLRGEQGEIVMSEPG